MNKYLLTIILGTIVGFMGGLTGRQGDTQILAGLLLLGIVKNQKQAAGTTLLFASVPFMWIAASEYYSKGDVDIKIVAVLIAAATLFSYLGAKMNYLIPSIIPTYMIAVTSLLSTVYFFYRAYKGEV